MMMFIEGRQAMRRVDTKDLLKYALNEKEDKIQIEGKFADTVMTRYGSSLSQETAPINPLGPASYIDSRKAFKIAAGPVGGLMISKSIWDAIKDYEIEEYKKGQTLVIKRRRYDINV